MMTPHDIELLELPEIRRTIRDNVTHDPATVALSLREHQALISTQIKYLQRARTKLPTYYEAGCILPPLSYEQASSEQTAATKKYAGDLCIDLTCGLGVDSLHFSRSFKRVVAVEQQELLATLARINFGRMGVENVEVVQDDSTVFVWELPDWLKRHDLPAKVDLIYIDPDRRGNEGQKLFLLEDCSPNVVTLMPLLLRVARRIVVKCSPLFDVAEAFRLFGTGVSVEVVSWQGECKELLIEITTAASQGEGCVKTTMAGSGSLQFRCGVEVESLPFAPPYAYLFLPDVSLYKARMVRRYAAELGLVAPTETGYCFGNRIPDSFFGRVFAITQMQTYQPKRIKTQLKGEGVRRSVLLKRDFQIELSTLARALGIGEGGTHNMAFTQIQKIRYTLTIHPIP